MSEMMETKPTGPSTSLRAFVHKRLFSLFGLVPLGVYVIWHLWNNNSSWQGADVFNKHLVESRTWPTAFLYTAITIVGLYLPLAFHALYGIVIARKARSTMVTETFRSKYFGMLKFLLQRLSGIGILFFVIAHVYKTKFETAAHGGLPDFNHMREGLSENLTLTVYVLAILGIAYHLANGLWSAAITWGFTVNAKSQAAMEKLSVVLFLVIAALGLSAIYGFIR